MSALKKSWSDSARAASLAARQGGSDYESAKSGGEGGSTPGQRDSKRRAVHDAGPLGDRALKHRAAMDSLLAPSPSGIHKKPMSTSEAIRKYGFEDKRTIRAAEIEQAKKGDWRKQNYDRALGRIIKDVKASTSSKSMDTMKAAAESEKKAYEALGHAKKVGNVKDVPALEARAKSAASVARQARKVVSMEIDQHPKVKEFKAAAKAYLDAKGR